MRKKVTFIVLLGLVAGFFACQKEDLTNTEPSVLGVKIIALNKDYSLPVGYSGTKSAAEIPSMSWDTVQMVVSRVKMEAELKSLITHRDSIEIEYKWTGPQLTDLLDSTASFGNFVLQPGFYDEIEISVKGLREDMQDSPVFYMSGNYTNESNITIPVVVEMFDDIEFKTEKDSVEVTEENMEITSYIQLFLDELFEGISPEQLDNGSLADGTLVISEDSNTDLYQSLMGKLEKDHHIEYHHQHKYQHHDDEGEDHDED